MKYLFALIAAILSVSSWWVWTQMPDGSTERQAIIYWTTDPNPARIEQVRLFDEWQVKRGLSEPVEGEPDEGDIFDEGTGEYRRPLIELRLDTGNADPTKKKIQSVSGVAADAIDLIHGVDMRFFADMGVLEDLSPYADRLGFSLESSLAALGDELSIVGLDGQRRQYQYPCNVAFTLPMVNKKVFETYDLEPPSGEWTIEEFEELGLELIRRANEPNQRIRRIFMMDGYNPAMLYMTQGVDRFNETLTDVNLEDPRVIDALERHRRWTYDYRLIPSSEDLQAEASAGGYAGGGTELLENDRVGMINGGRWHLIRFRQTNKSRIADGKEPLRFGTAEYPNGGFRLAEIGTRAAAVYVDGNRTDRDLEVTFPDRTVTIEAGAPWAVFFIAFLASEDYNAQIIADSDGLPPNPAFMRSKAYLEPEESAELGIYAETEYEIHEPHFEVAQTLAMPRSYSPFVLYSVADAAENRYRSRFLAEPPDPAFSDAAIAMAAARREILSEIRRELEQRPELREEYERRLEAQARIDEAKRTGAKIDANDIYNGFYLRYYREQGMLDESTLRPEQQGVPIAPPAQLDQTADRSPESESTSESSAVNVTEPVEEMIEDTADAPGVPIERVRDVRDELEAEPGASTESALETEPESSPMSSLQDRLRRDRVPETRPLTPLNLDRLRPSTSPATQPAD